MPTTIPISAWSGKFSLFRRCCTSLAEISAPELLGLPARKRFFPNYDPSPTAAIPKLSLPMQTMKMNTTTCECGSTDRSGLTPPDGSNIAWPFVPAISYYSTVMNSNENAGPTVEIGDANFDRGVRNATQSAFTLIELLVVIAIIA